MARYVLTDPQLEALKAGWEAGSTDLTDEQWVAVHVALMQPPPAGRGRVEIELDEAADADLRAGFAAALDEALPALPAMADAMAGVAELLDIRQGSTYGR